jgi:amidase
VDDLAFSTATELLDGLSRGSLTGVELLEHSLQRVERHNPALNAVVTLDAEGARARARAADHERASGRAIGSLHGLPLTIKDSHETEGLRTTSGSRDLASYVPGRNAPPVRRLVEAGAIVFGKTNLPRFAGDYQTSNALFGTTNNPWDVTRSPGGSSGGAAAAVAAGLTSVELGSDIAGSIRVPASFCGIYGHKPSFGIVAGRGHDPGPPGRLAPIDIGVIGPLARGPDDLELMLRVLAGPGAREAIAWRFDLPPPRRTSLADYRAGVWLDDPQGEVDAAALAPLSEAIEALAHAGVRLDERARPGPGLAHARDIFERLLNPIGTPLRGERFESLRDEAAGHVAGDDPDEARRASLVIETHLEWLDADEERARIRAAFDSFFRDYDLLLCPVCPVAAIAHDHRPLPDRTIEVNGRQHDYLHLGAWLSFASMAYLPATVAPVGRTAAGLPVGLQIIGPYLEDLTPIDFARRATEKVGGFEPPPEYRD